MFEKYRTLALFVEVNLVSFSILREHFRLSEERKDPNREFFQDVGGGEGMRDDEKVLRKKNSFFLGRQRYSKSCLTFRPRLIRLVPALISGSSRP